MRPMLLLVSALVGGLLVSILGQILMAIGYDLTTTDVWVLAAIGLVCSTMTYLSEREMETGA